MTPHLAALAALLLLATGCSGDDDAAAQPTEPTTVSPSPTASPTAASESASPEPAAEPLVFHGGTGASMRNGCGDDSPGYVSFSQSADVTSELRLGDVAVAGAGRLVGRVSIAPTRGRGPDRGTLVIDDRPGFGGVDDGPEWSDRVRVPGLTVQPGAYLVFAQVELAPGESMDGLVFAYTDTDTESGDTGSAQLDVTAELSLRCRG